MDLSALEEVLQESLQDHKLDQQEKAVFKDFAETLEDDRLRFIRNKAFELSRPYIKMGGEEAINVLGWLERVVKSIQPKAPDTIIQSAAYFSPGDSCRNRINSLLRGARARVDICVFTISDNEITQSILKAHQRGVVVTVISDNDKANDKGSDIQFLIDKGVKVLLDQSPHHMHHKFAIFDQRVLVNGSFNWTHSATQVNEENILVTSDAGLVTEFSQQFEKLKNSFS